MEREKIESLIIIGRIWNEKTYGNTYHTATVYVNGRKLKSDITYGYENQYLITALNMLTSAGYDIPEDGIDALAFIHSIADRDKVRVARKCDL